MKNKGTWIRRGIALLAFGIALYLFWPLIGELRKIKDLLQTAAWGWMGAAFGIQLLSYASLTWLNYLLLKPFKGKIGFGRLMACLPAIAFIEVALPSAGLSGITLRARFLGQRGYSVEVSLFTLILETVYLAVCMASVSLFGLWWLVQNQEVGLLKLAIIGGLTIILLAAGTWVYLRGRERQNGIAAAEWIFIRWNCLLGRFGRPQGNMEKLSSRLATFYDSLDQLNKTPIWGFLAASIGRVGLDVLSLGACFTVFNYTISPGILLTGYGIILAFSGLAALPGGLGLVDASLAIIYAQLGTPGAVAVAAALTYRLIAFWLLRFIGFIAWQFLEARP